MKIFITITMFIVSQFVYAQTFNIIKNPESVFIRQMNEWSCWAATAEALHNYSSSVEDMKSQEIIKNENPHAFDKGVYDKIDPYFLGTVEVEANPENDYLLGQVLSSKKYQAKFVNFNGAKVRDLIDSDQPVILNYDAHMMMIFGYFKAGGNYFYYIYDPNSLNLGSYPIYYYAESKFDWISENLFVKNYKYFWFAKMIYLEKR